MPSKFTKQNAFERELMVLWTDLLSGRIDVTDFHEFQFVVV